MNGFLLGKYTNNAGGRLFVIITKMELTSRYSFVKIAV